MAVLGSGYNTPFTSFDPDVINNDYKSWSKTSNNDFLQGEDSNIINYWNTQRTNYQNMLQWQATNTWNKYMWDLENEYNSPSSQMERYMQAGINPLWAMSDASPSTASQLTAQQPHPAVPASFSYDPQKIASDQLIAAQTNALNGLLGFGDLAVKEKSLDLQSIKQGSEIKKIEAETEKIKSETTSNEFLNKINIATYQTQVDQIVSNLNQTKATIANLEALTDLSSSQKDLLQAEKEKEAALKSQIDAATEKINQETQQLTDYLKIAYRQLAIDQQNANSNSQIAAAASLSAEAAQYNAQTNDARLNFDIESTQRDLELKSNSQILQIVEQSRSWIDKTFGSGSAFSHFLGHGEEKALRHLNMIEAAGAVLKSRQLRNPSVANTRALQDYNNTIQRLTRNLRSNQFTPFVVSPAGSSVYNPSQSWSQ